MFKTFNELWERCEKFHQELNEGDESSEIINDLIIKLTIYNKIIEKSSEISQEQKEIKLRLFGEILLSFTNLSLKEDINVFEALNISFQSKSIDLFSKKYND